MAVLKIASILLLNGASGITFTPFRCWLGGRPSGTQPRGFSASGTKGNEESPKEGHAIIKLGISFQSSHFVRTKHM